MPKIIEDLIWVSVLAVYLTGLVGCLVYLARNPGKDGRPWIRRPSDAVFFAVALVAWPALPIGKALGFTYGSKEE